MKLGVNGRFLTKPYTGIGQYTRFLFGELARQNPEVQVIMVTPEEVKAVDFPKNVEVVVLREPRLGTTGMRKTWWEQITVPKYLLKRQVDVMHVPYPANPWWGFKRPVVVTVHDTIPWTMPEYRRGIMTKLYQGRAKRAVHKAHKVLTVSQSSQKRIAKVCKLKTETIKVIADAPAPYFLQAAPQEHDATLQRYGLHKNRRFILYAGGFDARKQVDSLVNVYRQQIASSHNVDLVLIGGKAVNDHLYKSFDQAAEVAGAKGHVLRPGFIPEEDMPALYQGAYVFVHLSQEEGFNLPVVEAAVSGVPVVVSNIDVHHEVLGEYGLYVDVHDAHGLTSLLQRLLEDESFYVIQKRKMAEYNCSYSWEKSAQDLMEVYRSCLV